MSKTLIIFIGLMILLALGFALLAPEFFRNLGTKMYYNSFALVASKEKMDKENQDSLEKAKANSQEVTIVLHGAGAQYYNDVYGTILWLKKNGVNAVSFDYDYKSLPDESASELEKYVQKILLETGTQKVNIYGICLGGIIAKYYAEAYRGAENIRSLVTVISPAINEKEKGLAYNYNKRFSFDPDPWDKVLDFMLNKNPVEKHMYVYCKKDWIVPAEKQYSEVGNYVGMDCGHSWINVNPEILNKALNFIKY